MVFSKLFWNYIRINKRRKSNWLEPNPKRTYKYDLIGKLMRVEMKLLVYLLKSYPKNTSPKLSRKTLLDFKYEMF